MDPRHVPTHHLTLPGCAGPVTGCAAAPAPQGPATALYFRCPPLRATLSLAQCRINRTRPRLADLLAEEDPYTDVQPASCWSCSLAPRVEAGQWPFHTAAAVAAGTVPRAAEEGRPWLPDTPPPGEQPIVTWPGSA